MTPRGRTVWPVAVLMAMSLAACSSDGDTVPDGSPRQEQGGGGFLGFGGDDKPVEGEIGVNSLLWRAALDTVNFMPLALTDSFGGVIITDWHSDPKTPNERFKMQIYILDTRLRADGVKVNVFKQVQGAGGWTDAAVDEDTAPQIENAILSRARELRLATLKD
jgi:hypothetical protein